jgi:hypothetical protein
MPAADHQKTFAAEGTHVGDAVGDKLAVGALAESRNAGVAQRIGSAKRAGAIEDQVCGFEAFNAVVANEQTKRHVRPFGIADSLILLCCVTSDCHNLGAQMNRHSKMCCKRGEIAIGELCSGEMFLPVGQVDAARSQQSGSFDRHVQCKR